MASNRLKGALFGNEERVESVYSAGRKEQVAEAVELYPDIVCRKNRADHLAALGGLDVIFATWGMFPLTDEEFALLPNLKAVFYAAGSVQGFARPFLERDIIVTSAWAANGIPVAEFTLAQTLLALKRFFPLSTAYTTSERVKATRRETPLPGVFGETVSLLGAGMIGRKVIELLRPFELETAVFDPFLDESGAAELGVQKVSLEEAFSRGYVVSNHVANLPETVGMIRGEHFRSMRPGATFINTGRGATVVEEDLIAVARERPDLTFLLDVTHPEPPVAGSPLYDAPNVFLTPHIAGSLGNEVVRLADYALDSFAQWRSGKTPEYAVTLEMLERMA